jgi:hypothetical protein
MVFKIFPYDNLYDSQMKEDGRITYPHSLDKKVLLPISDDFLTKLSDIIPKEEFSQFFELLPVVKKEKGKLFMPGYGNSRIGFILEIIDKWKYDYPLLKEIIQREEFQIDEIWTTDDLAYDDVDSEHEGCNKLKFYIELLKKLRSANRDSLKLSDSFRVKEQSKKIIKNINYNLKKIGRKSYDVLSDQDKENIDRHVFRFKQIDEFVRIREIFEYRAKILLGFSPDVLLKESGNASLGNETYDQFREKNSSYPYIVEYETIFFAFGDWNTYSDRIFCSFFSTPEFIITDKDGEDIIITIRDPQKVNVRYMRRIAKVYGKMRKKKNYPASAWGEKSGKKRMQRERNKTIKMLYQQQREEKPNVSADRQLQAVVDQVAPEYGQISLERAKRIVYTKR